MSKLIWTPEKEELGVDRGVLYPPSTDAVAWNGIISVVEASEVGQVIKYQDGVRYRRRQTRETFTGSIYTFGPPVEFYDSWNKMVPKFGFSYRVLTDETYNLHLAYNLIPVAPQLVYKRDEASIYRIDFSSQPVDIIPQIKKASHLIIRAALSYSWVISALEDVLYGTDSQNGRLPTPQELFDIFEDGSILKITDNGDGTWTADGPDSAINFTDANTFQISWDSAVYIDVDTYRINSL